MSWSGSPGSPPDSARPTGPHPRASTETADDAAALDGLPQALHRARSESGVEHRLRSLLEACGTGRWRPQVNVAGARPDLVDYQYRVVAETKPAAWLTLFRRVRVLEAAGAEGIADLSDLAGKGMWRQWEKPDVWESVRVEDDTLAWGSSDPTERLDISRGSLYLRVTGLTWKDLGSARFAVEAAKRLGVSA